VAKYLNTQVEIDDYCQNISIKGQVNINNEQQKSMFEVYSEIVIATELFNLLVVEQK